MKKILAFVVTGTLLVGILSGCAGKNSTKNNDSNQSSGISGAITVVSREEGSGTRGAFIELFGIEEKDENGEKIDNTTDTAEITDKTSVMMTTIAGNPRAIGYISLGSLNETVKALKIDGTAPTAENVKNGTYKVSRPFNIATQKNISDQAKDFIRFILSSNGQTVVKENGYIPIDTNTAYTPALVSGTITVGGSSSVSPIMEKLTEAYKELNPHISFELLTTDSTTGMIDAANGAIDIGMASRELKASETQAGLTATVIATDGIAVIVNNQNTLDSLTSEQVKNIFTGAITDWSAIA